MDADFGYPPSGTKVFGINGKTVFKKIEANMNMLIKEKLFNYFEITDITASAIAKISQETSEIRRQQSQYEKEKYEKSLEEKRSTIESNILRTYEALCNIDYRYKKQDDVNIICLIPFLKQRPQIVPDTLEQAIKTQIERANLDIATVNSFIDYIEKSKIELNELDRVSIESTSMLLRQVAEQKVPIPVSKRILSGEEINALIQFSVNN